MTAEDYASDAAKELAEAAGIAAADVKGTGKDGSITKADVQAVIDKDKSDAETEAADNPPDNPEIRTGKPKKEDVAAVAVNPVTGETSKVDEYGRPEGSDQYGQGA